MAEQFATTKAALVEEMAKLVAAGGAPSDRSALTLYEEQVKFPDERLGVKWWFGWEPRDPERKRAIIQEFLDEALAHYEAEVQRLRHEMETAPSDRVLSQKKAIEGARWTAFHTRTLSKYLKETYGNG